MQNNRSDRLDIIIVTWNAFPYLKTCLESIKAYTNITYKLTIVDNGSTDETKDFLKRCKDVRVIRNPKNLGYPRALLEGFNKTFSELTCIMNDDVIVSPGWLDVLTQEMVNNPEIAILGPTRPGAHFIHPYTHDPTKLILEESKIKHKLPNDQLEYFSFYKPYVEFIKDYLKMNDSGKITTFSTIPNIVSTCCAIIRRNAIVRVGGIVDPQFIKYGADDTDLCWRLMKSGYKIGISPNVYVHHFEHISVDKNNLDRQKYLRLNSVKLYKKWKSDINVYLQKRLDEGLNKDGILRTSWLLDRLYCAVGDSFWEGIISSKPT